MKSTSDALCASQPSTSAMLTRRAALGSLAALAASVPMSAQTACSTDACGAYPELTEGPFYVQAPPERADITTGVEGTKLVLRITVVDASCTPIEGATVDIWHATPDGEYSSASDGAMRGAQPTDADGTATLTTVYPGWYEGRTTHVHVKILVDGDETLTTQLFFADDVSDSVYASGVYASRGAKSTSNADDGVLADADTEPTLVEVTDDGAGGLVGAITIDV
jgi:protocatechuate 3,4-dioxygenase beta subunit